MNIAAYDFNKLNWTDSEGGFHSLPGSKLGSILTLLVRVKEKWKGESSDVTPWTSEAGTKIKYLPDTRELVK